MAFFHRLAVPELGENHYFAVDSAFIHLSLM